MTPQLDPNHARDSIRSAFRSWEATGVGLHFSEIPSPQAADICVEWRDSNDPDHPMLGIEVAHADYPPFPPRAALIPSTPPVPLHFDDGEQWAIGAKPQRYDVETVALHEIGHCLGLVHEKNPVSVMYGTMYPNKLRRKPHPGDIVRIRAIYSA